MNIQQIEEARALATPVTHNFTADDQFPAIVIQYVPALGTGGTSASVQLANDSLQFLVDSASPANADAIGTTGKVSLTTTYTTMGTLVDYINGRQAWRAYLVGALRAMTSVGLLTKTATRCSNSAGVTLYIDTTDYDKTVGHMYAISGEKFINNGVNGHVTDADSECENSLLYGSFLITGDSDAVYLKYWSGKQGSTETVLYGPETITLSTATVHGEENPSLPFITAKRGERLIVQIYTGSDVIGAPTINSTGQTAVLSNDRIVESKNYGDA